MISVYLIILFFLILVLGFMFFIPVYVFVGYIIGLALLFVVPFVSVFLVYSPIIHKPTINYDLDSAIVILGAGIRNNDTPSDILKLRLNTGAEINKSTGQKIIVTGDNSLEWHNEPKVMKNYLIKIGVNPKDIIEDFGGRRTMDSCYRVKNFFKVNKIILVSQAFHLSRAKFLCESVGLQVQLKAAQDTGPNTVSWGYTREIPAAWSALLDSFSFRPQVGSDGSEDIDLTKTNE